MRDIVISALQIGQSLFPSSPTQRSLKHAEQHRWPQGWNAFHFRFWVTCSKQIVHNSGDLCTPSSSFWSSSFISFDYDKPIVLLWKEHLMSIYAYKFEQSFPASKSAIWSSFSAKRTLFVSKSSFIFDDFHANDWHCPHSVRKIGLGELKLLLGLFRANTCTIWDAGIATSNE